MSEIIEASKCTHFHQFLSWKPPSSSVNRSCRVLLSLTQIFRTPLHLAIGPAHSSTLARLLLSHGANLLHQADDGRTPLHTFYNIAVKQLIFTHRENIDTTLQDNDGRTIVHYISCSSRPRCEDISWLPKYQLESTDRGGCTALHYAVQRGNLPLIQFLLKHLDDSEDGSDNSKKVEEKGHVQSTMTQPDYLGRTLLQYATKSSRT